MHRGTGDYSDWRSMRELDVEAGVAKGTAFRAFKQLAARLIEGQDFLVLDHQMHADLAAALHAHDRLYRGSVTPVLLAPEAAARVRAAIGAMNTRSPAQ